MSWRARTSSVLPPLFASLKSSGHESYDHEFPFWLPASGLVYIQPPSVDARTPKLKDCLNSPTTLKCMGDASVRVTADVYSHMVHGQDDAAKRWEEFQSRGLSEKRTEVQ
jgi:hypothetical protein